MFDEIIEISKEGKHRYEFGIPPGYGDSLPKYRKKGTQIFGDLIIWKQILEHSKESKKPVIFITNDIKKDEDWCYLEKNNPDRIDKPREELIKEIKDYSGVEFWMYSLTQFLYKANTYLKSDIREDIIDNIATKFGETENSNQLAKKVLDILTLFNDLCPIQNENYEEEIINGLVKYINTSSPELTILHETSINSYSRDLIIRENNQVVLIEVNFIKTKSLLYRKINELLDTLVSENIFNGVLYTPYFNNPYSFKFGSSSKNIDGKTYHVSQVFAKVAQ